MREDALLLYHNFLTKNPRNILEVGAGASTVAFCFAIKAIYDELMKSSGSAMVPFNFISIDVDQKRIDETIEVLKKYDLGKYVTFVNANSGDFMVKNCNRDSADFIFLDSSHSFSDTVLELVLGIPIMRKDGILMLHDTKIPSVTSAVYTVLLNNPNITFLEYNTEKGMGLITNKRNT